MAKTNFKPDQNGKKSVAFVVCGSSKFQYYNFDLLRHGS